MLPSPGGGFWPTFPGGSCTYRRLPIENVNHKGLHSSCPNFPLRSEIGNIRGCDWGFWRQRSQRSGLVCLECTGLGRIPRPPSHLRSSYQKCCSRSIRVHLRPKMAMGANVRPQFARQSWSSLQPAPRPYGRCCPATVHRQGNPRIEVRFLAAVIHSPP